MDRRLIALALLMNELGLKTDTFEDRKVLQWTIYLLQEMGLSLGFHYHWTRAPWSPDLTEAAMRVEAMASGPVDIADIL